MYLNSHQQCLRYKTQRGFLMPVALFIIVVLGALALMISKKVSQTSGSYLVDSISSQAFYAAESGAQAGMHELFFLDTDRQLVDGRCGAMSISQVLNSPGLNGCTVTVSCSCNYENGASCDISNSGNYLGLTGIRHSFYTLSSNAQCGVDPIISAHSIEVGASL